MTKIIYKNRHCGGYEYVKCPECNKVTEVNHPLESKMPYCGACGMAVLDIDQNYCCWCGAKFVENKKWILHILKKRWIKNIYK